MGSEIARTHARVTPGMNRTIRTVHRSGREGPSGTPHGMGAFSLGSLAGQEPAGVVLWDRGEALTRLTHPHSTPP